MNALDSIADDIQQAQESYREGTCRDRILHDLICADAARIGERLTFVDIGCGRGFDTDIPLQRSLVQAAGNYIGIEPDTAVLPDESITDVRRCLFEQVDLPPSSVHLAFAVMVLEHVPDPQPFWDKLYEILVPGGVFWGLTVDARHWFCTASKWSERLALKNWYLWMLMGSRGGDRYENYPVHYRCNTPDQVAKYTTVFRSVDCINFARVGQSDPIFPGFLRPISRWFEKSRVQRGLPGSLLAIRAVR